MYHSKGQKKERIFSDAHRENFANYADILRRIHARLVREGYFLDDGKTWDIFKVAKPVCTFEEEILEN